MDPVGANPFTNPEGLVNQIRETLFTTVTASCNLASSSSSTPSPPDTQTLDSLSLVLQCGLQWISPSVFAHPGDAPSSLFHQTG